MKKESFKQGITDGIPIALGYLAVSFTFGMMAVQGGLTIWQAVLISLTNLTSAGQFAGLDIIIAGGSLWEMALTQLIINLRYCLMSFSLSQKLRRDEPWGHRYGVAFGVTDEIFGVSASKPGKVSAFYNYGVMSVAIPGWTFGTLLGAVSGSLLPDFIMSALSVAIYGMFLAVIIPPSKKNKAVFLVVLGAMAVSTLFAWVPVLSKVSSGFVIIITTILVAGSSGAFFHIADTVIQMDNYMPVDITEKARELCKDYPLNENIAAEFKVPKSHRIMSKSAPVKGSKKDYYGHFKAQEKPERLKVKVHGRDGFSIGKQDVDLRYIEQLIDSEQTQALGGLLKYAVEKLIDGKRTLPEIVEFLCDRLEKEDMSFLAEGYISCGYAVPRRQEIYACFNRYRRP